MALLLVTILALVNFSINTNAQDGEKEIIWDNSLETTSQYGLNTLVWKSLVKGWN